MSKHYLIQKQNKKIIVMKVRDWAKEMHNQSKFPNYSFENSQNMPTPQQINSYLKKDGWYRDMFNGDWYSYNPNEISENDLKANNFEKKTMKNKEIIKTIELSNDEIEVHPYYTTNGFENQLNLNKNLIVSDGYKDGGIWFDDTKTIICGTFPPRKEYFFANGYLHYSSSKNKFWKHIDIIYNKSLYLNSKDKNKRITNSIDKIEFIKTKKIGFIDIFSKIKRKDLNSAKDIDLRPIETIFQNGIFDEMLKCDVRQFIFVYSLSRKIFFDYLQSKYGITPKLKRKYRNNGITLEVSVVNIFDKEFYLSYAPIHGNIKDVSRIPALKKAIEFEFD